MHEDLLGYLLGALSADEQRRVEDALAADPELRRELERIQRSLEPLEDLNDDVPPPSGLADRTLEAIDRHEEAHRPTPRSVQQHGPSHHSHSHQSSSARPVSDRSNLPPRFYSISDGIVLALVGLVAITMLLPALANSRYEARKGACQNNLRLVGGSLIQDSYRHGGEFMPIPLDGQRAFDGVFASTLVDRQMLPVNTTLLLCPGVAWQEDMVGWRVPTLEEIDQATGVELDRLQQMAGGSYSFAVGYIDQHNRYKPIRNAGRANYPILADQPSLHLKGRQSANHGGRGQNFMYEDGHITFVTKVKRFGADDPWRNDAGHAEAGRDPHDAVLLRSEAPPLLRQPQ